MSDPAKLTSTPNEPLFIAGPTASGKSALALRLAERLQGEIISVDSMQVYQGLDIGTAKPSPEEQGRIRHHLIDLVEPDAHFDAAQFLLHARSAESQIRARGKRPIYCGGTGLYFRALVSGLGVSPASDPAVRAELEATPLPDLLAELQAKDPAAFDQVDRENPRRVIRALEVIRLTGKPFSTQRAAWTDQSPPGIWIGLSRERADLTSRINQRVDAMFAAGLVEETRHLLARGLEQNRTAMQAIGYRQVVEHISGERSLPDTIELVKIKTRQFARRQMTWFKRQLQLQWITVAPGEQVEKMVGRVLPLVSHPPRSAQSPADPPA